MDAATVNNRKEFYILLIQAFYKKNNRVPGKRGLNKYDAIARVFGELKQRYPEVDV